MPVTELTNIQPNRILVITLRFLGDSLLATPLIHSLNQAYPNATLDVLTFKSNAGMFEGNADINKLIVIDTKPSITEFTKLLFEIFRSYDLAISTQAGDRPALCAIMAGKLSLGFVTDDSSKDWWKKWLLTQWLLFSRDYEHAVLENLRFCTLLGITPIYRVIPPRTQTALKQAPTTPYAVLHMMPQWRYKEWHQQGWRAVIDYLSRHGLSIVLTGSAQAKETQYIDALQKELTCNVVNLAGQLSLAQLSNLIKNAALFIGPDTGITHLAAATGTTTLAIFGPTDPKKWAPWPAEYALNQPPFKQRGTQQIGNVYLIQGQTEQGCLPCQLEGCENHRNSHSNCLDQLPAENVIHCIGTIIDNASPVT